MGKRQKMIPLVEKVIDWDMVVKVLALIVPLVAGYVGYKLGFKAKKAEILLQNKVAAFQQLNEALVEFKRYLGAVEAENTGNEFAEAPEEGESALTHRQKLYRLADKHAIFLNRDSRFKLDTFLGNISLLNNAELYEAAGNNPDINWMEGHGKFAEQVDEIIDILYKDLNL